MTTQLEFFQAFFNEGDPIMLRIFPPGEGVSPETFWATSPSQAVSLIQQHDSDRTHHVYFGIQPRTLVGHDSGVDTLRWFWVDIDAKKVKTKKAALKIVESFPLTPTFIVDSGYGIHAYWKLRNSQPATPELQSLLQQFEQQLQSDAVHDPQRIMRVPSSMNVKKGSAVECCVLTSTGLEWSVEALMGILQVRPQIRAAILEGNLEPWAGDRSRADYAVALNLLQHKVPEEDVAQLFAEVFRASKYHDPQTGGQHYLQSTLAAAKQEMGEGASDYSKELGVFEDSRKVYTTDGKNAKLLTTFTFQPNHVLQVSDDSTGEGKLFWSGTLHAIDRVWENVIFPVEAFNSRRELTNVLSKDPSWSFFGTDTDAVKLKEFFRLKSPDLKVRQATKQIGRIGNRWYWGNTPVLPAQVEEVAYFPDETHLNAYPLDYSRDVHANDVKVVLKLLPFLNRPGVIVPVLGWLASTPYKIFLQDRGFPILNVYGTMGCGKSTLVSELLYMFGYREPRLWSAIRQTPFALMKLASHTATVPLALDEYRLSEMHPEKRAQLQNFLIEAYMATVVGRGRADLSLALFRASAPLIVLGEERIETPEALTERIIQVSLRREDVAKDTTFSRVYKELHSNEGRGGFSTAFINWTLSHPLPLDRAEKYLMEYIQPNLDIQAERIRRNLLLIIAGYEALRQFALEYGVTLYEPRPEEFTEPITAVYSPTGGVNKPVDGFLADILNWIGAGNEDALRNIPCRLDLQEPSHIWIARKPAYEYWLRRTSRKETTSFTSLHDQLEEMNGMRKVVVVPNKPVSIRGATQNAMCLSIMEAAERYSTPTDFELSTITIVQGRQE